MKSVLLRHSLKTRVIVVTLTLFLSGIWSLVYFSSQILKKDMLQVLGEQQISTATIVASDIDQRIDLRLRSLEKIARNIKPTVFNNTAQLQQVLEQSQLLTNLFNGGVYAIRRDGIAVADIPVTTGRIGMDVSTKGWMVEALEGKTVVGKPVIGKMLKEPVFTMATPVRDADGTIIGVLAAVTDLAKPNFLDKIIQKKYGKAGGFLLFDKQNRLIVTATDKSRVMETLPPSGVHATLDLFLQGHQGVEVVTDLKGVDVVAVVRPVPNADWIVATVLPTVEAFAPIRSMQQKMLLAAVLLTMLTGVLIWFVLRRQLAPMLAAIDNLSSLAETGVSVEPLPIQRQDEVGQLLHTFNRLIATLVERETKLTETQEQLLSITNSTLNAIIMMDNSGVITFWNPAAERILGYSSAEAIGKDLHILIAPEKHHAAYHNAMPLFVQSGQGNAVGKVVELTAIRKDRTEIIVSLALSKVHMRGAWYAVGILRDITDLKQYQQDLIEARYAAEAANRAKSQFLANMSHEIRTPLNGVIGMTQLLQFTQPTDEQKEYIGYLEQSGKNLLALLNDILDLSRIEADKMYLEETDFSLEDCINEVVATQSSQINQKSLQLVVTLPDNLPETLVGDPLRFKQIFLNLLANAVKFTSAGMITIKASIVSLETSTITLLLEVSDTGFGMDSETLTRIFSPFEQADNSNTRVYGGSGLGLTICRRLAGLMGGSIWAESTPDQGSSFYVELTFGVAQNKQDVEQQDDPASRMDAGLKSLKILVADDNKLNADTLVAMLKKIGHTAEVAMDGKEALDRWHASAFDCILMDISMPVMDGCQATATIREQELKMGGHTPIIALTAHALQGDRERFLASGFDGYVAKPVQLAELSGELKRLTVV